MQLELQIPIFSRKVLTHLFVWKLKTDVIRTLYFNEYSNLRDSRSLLLTQLLGNIGLCVEQFRVIRLVIYRAPKSAKIPKLMITSN